MLPEAVCTYLIFVLMSDSKVPASTINSPKLSGNSLFDAKNKRGKRNIYTSL